MAACHQETIDEDRTSLHIRRGSFDGADLGGVPIAGGKIGLTRPFAPPLTSQSAVWITSGGRVIHDSMETQQGGGLIVGIAK